MPKRLNKIWWTAFEACSMTVEKDAMALKILGRAYEGSTSSSGTREGGVKVFCADMKRLQWLELFIELKRVAFINNLQRTS